MLPPAVTNGILSETQVQLELWISQSISVSCSSQSKQRKTQGIQHKFEI